jgi:hypothetical protein
VTGTLGSKAAARAVRGGTVCRFCNSPLDVTVVDLGMSPLCETLVRPDALEREERFYPLHVRVCTHCWLMQLPEFVAPEEIFREYAYFSSYSESWIEHSRRYVDMIVGYAGLTSDSFVVEVASNDGYLLQHFLPKGIDVLGIEPALNVAEAARDRGVPTLTEFFGTELAAALVTERGHADLVIGNNVLAQVPDLNDFVAGVAVLLAPEGTATFEVPHVQKLLDHVEYDTIYHEHYSYFSVGTLRQIFQAHGLALTDVEELASHGGSVRVYVRRAPAAASDAVAQILGEEEKEGLRSRDRYLGFAAEVHESKRALLELLIKLRRDGQQVVAYGAPGKGNTLLNYCGIGTDLLDYAVDRNPYKHGCYTPGTRIPIFPPERLAETQPDTIVILPWNLAREISEQLRYTREWGATLVVPIPRATVFEPGELPSPQAAS